MKIHPFVDAVASLQFDDCFNPYSDRCEVHDRRDAPRRRSVALSAMLRRAIEEPVDAIWIGRDLGYRGGRRTGLALTDDVHLSQHGRRWNLDLVAERPTIGSAVAERTAAVIWGMLEHIDARIFLWNVFLFIHMNQETRSPTGSTTPARGELAKNCSNSLFFATPLSHRRHRQRCCRYGSSHHKFVARDLREAS